MFSFASLLFVAYLHVALGQAPGPQLPPGGPPPPTVEPATQPAASNGLIPTVQEFCTCETLINNTSTNLRGYRCHASGSEYTGPGSTTPSRLWNPCTYSATSNTCVGSGGSQPLYNEINTCISVINELQGDRANLHLDKYSDLRCCLSNPTENGRLACATYICTKKFLLYMPYGCQTEFFSRVKVPQCWLSPKESVLRDCYENMCEMALLKFDSADMFYVIFAVAGATCLCGVFATIYVKRKRQRMLEWAKLERKVLGGDGGEDDLLDILSQKQRKARVWYYVSKQGKVVGPLKEEDMRLRKVAGLFDEDLMVRCNDSDWKTLSKFYANPEVEAFESKTRPMLTNRRR